LISRAHLKLTTWHKPNMFVRNVTFIFVDLWSACDYST